MLSLALLAPKLAQDALIGSSQAQRVRLRNKILPARRADTAKTCDKRVLPETQRVHERILRAEGQISGDG